MLLALRNDARFYEGGKIVDVAGVGKTHPREHPRLETAMTRNGGPHTRNDNANVARLQI